MTTQTQTEALKLALEAIEHLSHNARKAGVEMGLAFVVADEAITAIKEVLAQPEQSGLNPLWLATHPDKLAQPEQEPVAIQYASKAERDLYEMEDEDDTIPPQRKPLATEHCTWKQHDDIHMPDTWEADCGAMWTFTEGGPKYNDMHYCPECGKLVIEAAHAKWDA